MANKILKLQVTGCLTIGQAPRLYHHQQQSQKVCNGPAQQRSRERQSPTSLAQGATKKDVYMEPKYSH